MAKFATGNPILMSNMKSKIEQSRFNNGISFDVIDKWVDGSIFVVQRKEAYSFPQELVIKKVEIVKTEHASFFENEYNVVCHNGLIVRITHGTLFSPQCENYEIFKNWKHYFLKYDAEARGKKKRLEELKAYLEQYDAFQKKFKEENPEKLI